MTSGSVPTRVHTSLEFISQLAFRSLFTAKNRRGEPLTLSQGVSPVWALVILWKCFDFGSEGRHTDHPLAVLFRRNSTAAGTDRRAPSADRAEPARRDSPSHPLTAVRSLESRCGAPPSHVAVVRQRRGKLGSARCRRGRSSVTSPQCACNAGPTAAGTLRSPEVGSRRRQAFPVFDNSFRFEASIPNEPGLFRQACQQGCIH